MRWTHFEFFGPLAILFWLLGLWFVLKKNDKAVLAIAIGAAVSLVFIIGLWIGLKRPPFRTMGETRLWYSLFLSVLGILAHRRWGYPWLLAFGAALAIVFAAVNLLKPEIHSKTLMPALMSPYFIPHVTLYILSYALLAASAVGSVVIMVKRRKGAEDPKLLDLVDNLVHVGVGALMLGLILGALWAKAAWGHYWSWDPKETWAFVTAAAFLLYIHLRRIGLKNALTLWVLPVAFLFLMMTWLGVNYLPTAAQSVHVY
ncbi:MAG: cytochrome c biogenesis protein CcsA [Deltaproteobacteria bacterium]|jgi:ABC-type transport system involved in cytochrome c biogenesis permease subunit|nr:cytochrome c biogenesis protein CcsA [Deltaproteobacteria bacterium]